MFDALGYSHELEEAGFTKKQAEKSVKLLMEILKENLASKTDLKEVKIGLQNEIKEVRNDLKEVEIRLQNKMKEVRTSLQTEIKEVKTSLQTEIKEVKTSLQNEIKDVKTTLQNDMSMRFFETNTKINSLESRLIYKLGALMFLVQGAFVALAKFI